jgi:hypothetical protein
MLTYIIP